MTHNAFHVTGRKELDRPIGVGLTKYYLSLMFLSAVAALNREMKKVRIRPAQLLSIGPGSKPKTEAQRER